MVASVRLGQCNPDPGTAVEDWDDAGAGRRRRRLFRFDDFAATCTTTAIKFRGPQSLTLYTLPRRTETECKVESSSRLGRYTRGPRLSRARAGGQCTEVRARETKSRRTRFD